MLDRDQRVKIMKALILSLGLFGLVCCTSTSSSNTASNNGFSISQNGYCSDQNGNLAPNVTSCQNQTYNSKYFYQNGSQCLSRETYVVVDNTYCNSNPFKFAGLNCMDTFINAPVPAKYCVPSNQAYYSMTPGSCFYSSNQQPVGSNYPCLRQTTPINQDCWGYYYMYVGGNWTSQTCSGPGSYCSGATVWTATDSPNAIAIKCN